MVRFLTALVLMIAGAANGAPTATRPGEDASRLTLMTFNIRLGIAKDGENDWDHRKEILFDVFTKYQPDVVGLQEAYAFQIDGIVQAHPKYASLGVGREDGQSKGEFSSILYRKDRLKVLDQGTFWLSETPEVPGSKSWKTACTRVCTWARFEDGRSGRTFYFYNTHLDHISQEARERGIELIAKRMKARKSPDPTFLTGDFNAGEDNAAVAFVKGEPPKAGTTRAADSPRLVDSYRSIHAQEKNAGTFNDWKGKTTGDKIDYIFVPASIPVLSADILHDNRDGRYPSDHFPMIAVIDLAGSRGPTTRP
jgi:endonuclease/exonuclease/phosphatase family metal-dependent hydrolase